MAPRLIALIALLTLTALAGCSDGPPSGKLTVTGSPLAIEGTIVSTYVAESGGQDTSTVPDPNNSVPDRLCPDQNVPGAPGEPCVDPSSNYVVHFMTLPEPNGDGYSIFQVGGALKERSLTGLEPNLQGMWQANVTKEVDEEGQFERFELRMGSFILGTAGSAKGSQAFVASPALSAVTVTGTYKGHTLTIDVQGLPESLKPEPIGRFYTRGEDGNLSAPIEPFPVVAGVQEYTSKDYNIADFDEFHIHVGTSKIYLYQASLH
jgi:hypothetical protein